MARILIVEDESDDALLVHAIIEGSGHETYFAHDGEGAFKAYRSHDIDVVVTDLQMPGVDGLELISALLALFPEAAIIAVSGKDPGMLAKAKVEGARAGFSKPVDPEELLEAVGNAVDDG